MDSGFPFGANAPGEVTALVTASDRLTWRDVEAMRIADRRDVETIAAAPWARATAFVKRIKEPAVRAWAARWLTFCTVAGQRPPRHIGDAGKACRRVELELARLGVVDPEGFCGRELPTRGPSTARDKRRRQTRGGDCNGLREFNERMGGGKWIG